MFTLGKIRRLVALSLFAIFAVFKASATLTLSADTDYACPSEAVVLSVKYTDQNTGHWLGYKYSYDGSTWEYTQSMTRLTRAAVDMPDNGDVTKVYYQVFDEENGQSSNVVTVNKSYSSDCSVTCHQTSTGAYFNGTDFDVQDPVSGQTTYTPAIPDDIVSYFGQGQATVDFESRNSTSAYTVTTDVTSYFNGLSPSTTDLTTNYYYAYTNFSGQNQPFTYTFPYAQWHDKHYRFVMRFYLLYTCGDMANAQVKLETPQGNFGSQQVNIKVYDDANNTLLSDETTTVQSFGSAKLNVNGHPNTLLRIEAYFYGKFPHNGQNADGTAWNNYADFKMSPLFQQMGGSGCTKLAIDYISAEIESVCMDKGAYCVGDYATINAAGFPMDSKYTWQVQDPVSKTYTNLVIGGITYDNTDMSRISIPVNLVGRMNYRVFSVECSNGSCDSISIPFHIIGKDCDVPPIDSIRGDTIICAPSSAAGDTMTVVPIDINPNVTYHWQLTDPKGNIITDKSIVYQETSNVRGTRIILHLPATSEEGDYTISAYMTKTEDGYTSIVGDPVAKVIHVYKTPTAHFTVDGFINDGTDQICPSDNHQEIYATDNSKINSAHEYIYTWFHANSSTADGKTALIDLTAAHDSLCNGTLTKYKVGESVEISGIGCKATWDTILSVKTPKDPAIVCSSLGNTVNEIKLSAAQSYAQFSLPYPEVTGTCDRYPTVKITGVGTDINGNNLGFTISANLNDMQNNKVAEMTRKFTATAGPTGDNGVTVTYEVIDGCNKISNTCTIKYIIRDVTGPDIPCSNIPTYSTRLSYYNVNETDGVDTCEAYPGEGTKPDLLPVITAPVLTDQNGVDGQITGTYIGRLDNQMAVPTASEALFTKTKTGLNDPFPAGASYILWKFADAAGNASYCIQTVVVVDDKKPEINCPTDTKGNFSVQDATSDCGLSLDSLLAKLSPAETPTATDVCPTRTSITTARYFYRQVPATAWTEITDKSALTFQLGKTYELAWRFYKQGTGYTVDKSVYAECIRTFTVTDSIPPVTDCSLLGDTAVTVNVSTEDKTFDFASATEPAVKSTVTYTLKGFFKSIPSANDACSGELRPKVTVITPDGKSTIVGKVTDTEANIIKTLNLFHFPVGSSTIIYEYTDEAGNVSSCEQSIIVYKGIAMDCQSELTLYTDENCLGHLDVTAETVNTAKVSYVYTMKYRDYDPIFDFWNGYTVAEYSPVVAGKNVKVGIGPMAYVSQYGFDDLDKKTAVTETKFVDVYPSAVKKVTNVDKNGNATASSKTEVVKNGSDRESFPYQVVDHRFYNTYAYPGITRTPVSERTQVIDSLLLQTVTFDSEFTDDFKTFAKGTHKLVWYYDNGALGNEDSCVVIVSVVDSTAPSVKCGKWGEDIVRASDPATCQATIDLTEPTAEDLDASDNCSAADKLTISFQRSFKGAVSTNRTAPYEQGTTLVTWTIADEDGNKAYCKQNITVNDSTGPQVDCDKILVNPINVVADENCQVEKEAMVEAGLSVPVLDPSAELCSPTKDPIKGVGVRQDVNGKPDGLSVMEDPYPLGHTIIVWTFTDSLKNSSVCRQDIYVSDKTGPKVNCSEFEDNPVKYYLAPTECNAPKDSIIKRLGTHKVKDNCDADSIAGVPYLLANGTVRVAIPSAFIKDTTYTIEWVFTDEAGNESVCHQEFSVIDTTPPSNEGVCPDPEKTIAAKVSCTLSFSDLDLPELSINDQCDGILIGKLTGEVQQPGGTIVYPSTTEEFNELQYYAGTVNNFTWTFTDHAGLTSTCKMALTIADSIPPVINNCNTGNDATYEMSEGVCYAKWADLQKLIVIPVAYDECQELIDGTGSVPLDPTEIRRYFNDTLISVSTGSDTAWRADPFPRGVTRLVWVFTDRSGNVDSCAKTLKVIMRTNPSFICDSIKPNPMRPVAEKGTCSIFFKDLEFGKYYGFDACTGDSIPAQLLLAPVPDAVPVPTTLEFKVGDTISVFWVVTDADGNYSYCPQIIIPSHSNPINFDCSTLDTLKATALEGECYVPADSVNLPNPFAIDSCAQANGAKPDSIFGVPTRSDGLALMDNYPTGKTTISWMFVSPFNLNDTLICSQVVAVAGNKHFDLNCEEVLPTIHDTIAGCGPDGGVDMTAPQVADPCIADTMITGVAIARTDGAAITDPFNLGTTVVTWTFTDATGSITDTCHQTIIVLTDSDLVKPCDTAAMKTIEVPAPDDACTVPASEIDLVTPYALHPCTNDTVWGVLSRPGISDLNAPYNIGLNRLIWTFTDTTGTLANPSDTCQQFVKVGNVDVEPVECKNMPDVSKVLAEGNCTIDFSDFGLEIPAVIDRCPNGDPNADPVEILPTITRASKAGWSTTKVSEIGTFGVGRDTIFWDYTIAGVEYHCEQHIAIKDSVAPEFDCSKLQPIQAEAEEGKCEVDSSAVLSLMRPFPVATETCTGDSIVGVPTLEDGSPLPATFKVGDTVIVKWTFIDTLVNVKAKTCTQPVTVISNAEPVFDCNSLDTLKFVAKGSCSIDITEDMIPVPVAKDSCTGTDVPGVASRADGGAVYGTYNTGFVTLTWTFDSPYSTKNKICQQTVWVVTDLEIDAKCGEENYPTINVAVEDGVCQVPASEITPKLREHSAVNPCHNTWTIKGVASRSDGLSLDDDYPVGITTITWTFTDTTKTLLNPVSTCEQQIVVGDNNEPPVDCETSFPAANIYLDEDNCSADFTAVRVYLDKMPVNACNGDVAVLDTARQSGKLMSDPFEVGKDVIIWTFTFPTNKQKVVCRQNVEVFDTIAPKFDCNKLEPVITVAFSQANVDYVTYDEVVAKGFYIPTVEDKCCEVKTSVTRSDGKDLEDNYPQGETTITFVFSDDHGNDKVCSQIIKVTDMVPPTPDCPHFGGSYNCLSDIPSEMSYEEWTAAGGTIDFPDRVDFSTWKVVDKVIGDSCEAMVLRDYTFQSIRQDQIGCSNGPDTFLIKDNIAPEYVGISPLGEAVVVGCNDVSYNVPNVTASDNCDPNPTVKMTMVSTQGSDPSQCSAYTYDIIYTFTAVDRCGNAADPVTFTVHVKDTLDPIIHVPEDWNNIMYPTYLKNCLFGVPDITNLIPYDSIELACGEKEFIKVWQDPLAGDTIDHTIDVALHYVDVCGNETVLYKTITVQKREEIVKLIAADATVCGNDDHWFDLQNADNVLTNSDIIDAIGNVAVEVRSGVWREIPTNMLWDYYRGGLDQSNLIYSSYSDDFASAHGNSREAFYERAKCLLLTRSTQSDKYYYVVRDTVTGCSDTDSVYINVVEKPRIALAKGSWSLCEGDSLAMQGDFGNSFIPCVDDMGAPIYSEGWMTGDSSYVEQTPIYYQDSIVQQAVYYATNQCGTTTSLNSLYTTCGGWFSYDDSLSLAGSAENMAILRRDSFYVSNAIDLDVYTHFDPTQVLLSTDPQDKARVWLGEEAELTVTMPYYPSVFRWMKVNGQYDGMNNAVYNSSGYVVEGGSYEDDDEEMHEYWDPSDTTHFNYINTFTLTPTDSSYYYVLVGNGVCPTVSSNLVSIDLLTQLPTAITPYTKDGMNDDFMRGHHVVIFNRYGQLMFEGFDGWDGTYRGLLVDPGVYFYQVDLAGVSYKGSIEVLKFDN